MNGDEYAAYRAETKAFDGPVVRVADVPGPDRTLVYGYSREFHSHFSESAHTVHVYKASGELHVVHYGREGERIFAASGAEVKVSDCLPLKRAYPERCDVGFARLVRALGQPLSFTNFDAARSARSGPFHGLLISETRGTASV